MNNNKSIFFDRDWTLIYDWWYLHKTEDIKILEWVEEWLKKLRDLWYKLIIISNQSWIWRGYYSEDDCNKFNEELENRLWIKFDDIYICPHSPEENCKCRKPNTLLVEKAVKKFNLNLDKCFFVWDKESDIQTWINAGCKTVLVVNNQYDCKLVPDYYAHSILDFAKLLQ